MAKMPAPALIRSIAPNWHRVELRSLARSGPAMGAAPAERHPSAA